MTAIVQHLTDGAFSTGKAITVASTGSANLLVAVITTDNLTTDTVTSITDGTSNFAQVPSARATNSSGQTSDVWWLASSNGGKTAITIAFNATTAWACEIYEVSGLTSPVVDVKGAVSSQSMVGTTCNGPSVTPTSPQFGVAGISCNNSSIAVGGNSGGSPNAFNSGGDISSTENGAACSLITTAAGSEQPIWTASAGSNTFCASCVFFANGSAPSGGAWSGSGSRRAPGQRGPFDRRGFLLSPYQQYSYVSSVTTFLVSSADGLTLYESLDGGNPIVSQVVQEEALASASQGQAIITEALASLSQSATVQEEALQGLSIVQAVIAESLASAANAVTVRDESTGLIALGATVQDESLASAANAATVQDESLATATAGQTVIEEALATATAAVAARYEALATALLSQIVQYEAGGIASSPVSNSVVVAIEALASATQSATNRLEALQQIAITAVVVDELLASAASSVTVRAEATQSVASLLTLIYESGGLPLGVPMLGINAIVFAAMATLAALDLMTTVATTDSLATAAASDSLVTLGVTDSLTTTSAFDG